MLNIKKKIKNFFFSCGLLSTSILLALFLGEGLVRIISPQQLIVLNDGIWTSDTVLSWKHVPNSNEEVNLGEKKVRFISDNNGNRISAPPIKNVVCNTSILFVGDSFLEALQVENENTFVELVRKSWELNNKASLCTVNTGVGGWGPNQYYLVAKQELIRRKYSLGIVFLYTGNDFVSTFDTLLSPRLPSKIHDFCIPSSLTFSDFKECIFYPVNDLLETKSHLFILLKNSSKSLLIKVGLSAEYFPPYFEKSNAASNIWKTTSDICASIDALFDSHETPVLFVLLPTPYQVHQEIFQDYVQSFGIDKTKIDLEQPNKLLSDLLKGKKITLLDPLEFMRYNASKGGNLYGKIDNHFNENGHNFIAQYLQPFIENVLLNENSHQ